jgi:exonuclease SbcD
MLTILHTADVHLDRPYSGMGMTQGIAAARREELRDAMRRFVDLARKVGADAVTIGGDLFEHERATADTGNFLRRQFERLAPIPAFIAPGNHDPYVPDSLYRRVDWPANVRIFEEPRFQALEIAPGVTLWGAGHDGPAVRTNLIDGLRVRGAGRHILLFHGSDVQNVPEGKPAHCPFRPEDVDATGADFALLGHYHGARLNAETGARFAYPGTPEPLDFSEAGEHHVLRLDVSDDGVTPTLVPFGQIRYATHRLDVSEMVSSDEMRAAIVPLPDAGAIVRVIIEGQLQPEVDFDVGALYNTCVERFAFLDIVDRTEPGYDFEQLAEESTTKGVFAKLMLARMARASGEELEVTRKALVLGLKAFDRRELAV